MKNALVPNEKQLVKGIVSAFNRMESAKKSYVISVIELGEKLIEAKKIVPFGQWESWLKANSEFAFGDRQAQKIMLVATNKLLVLEYFSDENSVNQLTKAIADATPEQLARVAQIEAERLAAEEQAKADRAAKAAELEAKKAEEQIIKQVQTKEPEIIEGDFTEVKPAEKQEEYQPEETLEQALTEANDMLIADNQELIKEIDSVTKILESNDQVSAAIAEAKKYRELNRVLNERVTGLQNEKNEAIRSVKHWKNRAEKAERELAAIKAAV